MERIATAGIIVFNGEEVLVVRHTEGALHLTGSIGFPGGRIEGEETPVQAAIRELKEETGLEALENDLVQLPTVYQSTLVGKEGPKDFTWTVYVCRNYSGTLTPGNETVPFWMRREEVAKASTLPNVKEVLEEAARAEY
jgi:8-oxo-dGTP diphosphatase